VPTEIDRDGVLRLVEAGAQLVDTLPADEYAALHLAGAVSVPLRVLDELAPERLERSRPVVVYCNDYI
jgi:rhodanese-related sulfurtransferase